MRIVRCLVALVLVFFISCDDSNYDLSGIIGRVVVIPSKIMVCNKYSRFADTINHSINLIYFYKDISCGSCVANEISRHEDLVESVSKYDIGCISIIACRERDNVVADLYNCHLEGTVYLDTCNAFLSANPQIPDNKLYHTFVINKEGKVLMVGNPFQNEKMEELFKKVIAKERKKQKYNKTAWYKR